MTQDLREAVEAQIAEWREGGEGHIENRAELTPYQQGGRDALNMCADELEELLQEHQE